VAWIARLLALADARQQAFAALRRKLRRVGGCGRRCGRGRRRAWLHHRPAVKLALREQAGDRLLLLGDRRSRRR
jgi:hypothetical protein